VNNLIDTVEYCFVVRAYDTNGNESVDSNEVCLSPATLDPLRIDDDGDGYTEIQGDCDDADALIHPYASETCGDGIDQDCSGTDALCPNDVDIDGNSLTENQGDCNDADSLLHHNTSETCCDGIDQDCSGDDLIPANIIADAGPDQKVHTKSEVLLNGANSRSSDNSVLAFHWVQKEGEPVQLSDTIGASQTFIAPPTEQALIFELIVTDEKGSTSTDSCIVNVSEKNEPPTSSAGTDIEVTSNQVVRLDGTGSMDDSGPVSYSWSQTEGPTVALSNPSLPSPEFISPSVAPEGVSLTFQLTVTDQEGLKDTDSCIVNVIAQNQPPEAVTNEYAETTPGMIVTLDGTLSTDIDDGIESYRWYQLEGPPVTFDNPDAAQVEFSAPGTGPYGTNLLFALKVKDTGGLKRSVECAVFVQAQSNKTLPFTVSSPTLHLFEKGKFQQVRASVVIIDDKGAVVKGAEVKGKWSLPGFNTESREIVYTNGAGEAKWDSDRFSDAGTLYFTAYEISIDGILYKLNIGSSMYIP
jgi:hypothetical protein